jgi:predicted metal-dependent hydrolase
LPGKSPRRLRYHGSTPPVQLDLPFLRAPAPEPAGPLLSIDFVRMRRARRYIIRVRPDGSVRVTVPRGGSRLEAARFLEKHAQWIAQEQARVRAAHVTHAWIDGATMMLRGEPVMIRAVDAPGGRLVRYGARSVVAPAGDTDLRRCIEGDLRRFAREELGPRLHALAAAHDLTVAGFTIRNQRSRWGSCSRAGRIALNYRLVQMPPAVCDYVMLHELMHIKQPNHSRRFWRLVEAACPDFREAERWLKVHGRGLL